MALIDCPECVQKISDQAFACPHCGYPMKGKAEGRQREKGLLDPLAEVAAMAEEFASVLRQALGGDRRQTRQEEKGEKSSGE